MKKTTSSSDNQEAIESAAPATVSVAYHGGPPDIVFYKREWRIGVPQTIPVADWVAMNNRADFGEFDFKEEA